MTTLVFRFQRGEPIILVREIVSGDGSTFEAAAKLKRSRGQVVPAASEPVVATFQVQFEPAAGGQAARFVFTVPANVTAGLPVGHYAADAVFSLSGEVVEITDPAFISLTESVSG